MDSNDKIVNSIERHFNGTPTIVEGSIKEGCTFENTFIGGYGTIIVDQEFLDDIFSDINSEELSQDFIRLLTTINNKVNNYFYSNNKNQNQREEEYSNSYVLDDEGMILGTKLSSLKGKNVAKCSEKSLAAYIILEKLYNDGSLKRKPSLILSTLKTKATKEEPHAFLLIDKEDNEYPLKHMLYDIENPTELSDLRGNKLIVPGMYSLTDEEYSNIKKGISCTPKSLFENLNSEYRDIGAKRIYGGSELNKQFFN